MDKNARVSLISVIVTAVLITINHLYSLGAPALILGAVLLVTPLALWSWYRNTNSPFAFGGYMLMNVWIILGFGWFKGFWKITLPLVRSAVSTSFRSAPQGPLGFVASGVLMFVGSLFVLYAAGKLIRTTHEAGGRSARGPAMASANPQLTAKLPIVSSLSLMLLLSALVGTIRVEAVPAASNATPVADLRVIKIGVIATTQGPAGLLGNSFLKSIQLAQEDLTHTTNRYELVIEQIPSPDQAEPAIKKLIETDRVDGLIVAMSMSGEIIKPYAAAAKIPLFCICSVGTLGDELYTFTTMPLAEDEATLWVREAQRRGITRIARLTQDFPSIDNHVRAMKAEAAKVGIEFVYEDRYAPTTSDFRSAIAAAKATSPDVYYVEGFNPGLDILGQQLREAGVTNMASVVAFSVSNRPELFEGGWYTDSYVRPAFKTHLDQRYPGVRLATHMMPYAYDSYRILVDAFESGQDVLTYVRNMTEFNGTAGMITKQAGTGNFRSAPAVWVIKAGQPTLQVP